MQDVKVIDFRVRPLTEESRGLFDLDFLQSQLKRGEKKLGRPSGPYKERQTPQQFIDQLTENKVSVAVIVGRDLEKTHGFKYSSEDVAKLVKLAPDRLVGFAGIDPNKRRMETVREVEKAADLGFKGVSVDPFMVQMYADDRRCYPIYTKCAELGLTVIITTGPTPWGGEDWYHNYAHPRHVDIVATDFPELKIICSHFGYPWILEMIWIAIRHPNVYVELSGITGLCKIGSEPMIEAINGNLEEQALYASAYPFAPLTKYLEFQELPFKPGVLENVLYKNAERILNINV